MLAGRSVPPRLSNWLDVSDSNSVIYETSKLSSLTTSICHKKCTPSSSLKWMGAKFRRDRGIRVRCHLTLKSWFMIDDPCERREHLIGILSVFSTHAEQTEDQSREAGMRLRSKYVGPNWCSAYLKLKPVSHVIVYIHHIFFDMQGRQWWLGNCPTDFQDVIMLMLMIK